MSSTPLQRRYCCINSPPSLSASSPPDSVTIPPRTPHNYDSAPEDCQLLVTVKPALELDRFFRAFLGLSRDGKLTIPEKGIPTPLVTFAALMYRYRREMAAPRIPLWLQRPGLGVLALLAKLLGRRGEVFGKTGTAEYTDDGRAHGWFVGYRGDLAFAVLIVDGGTSAPAVQVADRFLAALG